MPPFTPHSLTRILAGASVAALGLLPLAAAAQSGAPAAASPAAPEKVDLKFSFGPQARPGYTQVQPDDVYSPERGYGFDLGSKVVGAVPEQTDEGIPGYISGRGDRTFFFSAKIAPGAYRVNVTLAYAGGESPGAVKSETRRLMLEGGGPADGRFKTYSFLVHVRVPQIPGGGAVALKPRERDRDWLFIQWDREMEVQFLELNWDEKLTLEFSHARLYAVEITNAEKPISVFLIGDSTVTDQMMEPWGAWGQFLPRWFKAPVLIVNYAQSGETTASFIGERRWPKVLSEVRPGDYVLMQFGINDRSIPLDQFKDYFRRFIRDTREKGATPVLVSSQNLRSGAFGPDGKAVQTLRGYPYAMWEVATEEKAHFIDLNTMSMRLYEAIGAADLPKAFVDGTHQNSYGAYELAKCVVQGAIDAQLPLAAYVVDDWKPYDPSKPLPLAEFKLPPDPQLDPDRPGGPGGPRGAARGQRNPQPTGAARGAAPAAPAPAAPPAG